MRPGKIGWGIYGRNQVVTPNVQVTNLDRGKRITAFEQPGDLKEQADTYVMLSTSSPYSGRWKLESAFSASPLMADDIHSLRFDHVDFSEMYTSIPLASLN